jgi:hypothetical protein
LLECPEKKERSCNSRIVQERNESVIFITKDLQAAIYNHASAFKMLSECLPRNYNKWIELPSKKAEYPEFETAIVKIQEQHESSLSVKEKISVHSIFSS